jgi:hypothetical protein
MTAREPEPRAGSGLCAAWQRFCKRPREEVLGWVAFALMALAAGVHRYIFVFHVHPPKRFVWSDMQGYVDRAWRLADSQGHLNRFDSFYPPGTHVLMAPLMRLAGTKERGLEYNQWLWWFFAVGTLWAVGAIALRLFRHPAPAALAVGLLIWHWPLAAFSGYYMSENPFAFFMAVSLWLGLVGSDMTLQRRGRRVFAFACAGLVAGVGAAVRPQFFFGAVLLGLPLLHRRFPFVRMREALALGVMFSLPCLGAMELNSRAAGVRMGMSGNAGFNFFQGHCDVVHVETHSSDNSGWYAFAAPVRIQRVNREGKPEKRTVIKGHMAWENDYFFREGFRCIREDGWKHLERIYTNVEDLFSPADPWPPNTGPQGRVTSWMNHLYSHGLLFVVPLSLVLAWRRRPERWILMQLATLLPVGFMFYGDSRYRVPYDIFGYLLVAGIVAALMGWRRDPWRTPGMGWRSQKRPEQVPSATASAHGAV